MDPSTSAVPPEPVPPARQGARVEAPWAPPAPLRPRHPQAMLESGGRFRAARGNTLTVDVVDKGRFDAPTGRIVAADPCLIGDAVPYTVALAPGTHAFRLCTVRIDEAPERLWVAGAAVVVDDAPVATWEPALRPGQDPADLGDGEFFGFPVDAGMGCFLDAAGQERFAERLDDDGFDDELIGAGAEMIVQGSKTRRLEDPDSGASLVAFETGMGDGDYPVWVGRDADGRITALLADCLILDSAEPITAA